MANFYTGAATVAVTDGVATITKVTGDAFSLLTEGSFIQIKGGMGFVSANTGTVITTAAGWGGDASSDAVTWTGARVNALQTLLTEAGQNLQYLAALNDLPSGKILSAAAKDSLIGFDALIDLYLLGKDIDTPPGSPSAKDAYIVGSSPTGAWADYAGKIAYYIDGGWRFYTPFNGLRAYVVTTGAFIIYMGGAWIDWSAVNNGVWQHQGAVIGGKWWVQDTETYLQDVGANYGYSAQEITVFKDTDPLIFTEETEVYKGWFTLGNSPQYIAYAESIDGKTHWVMNTGSFVAEHRGSKVVKYNGVYYMFAIPTATTWDRINLFTSNIGCGDWVGPTQVMSLGAAGTWDANLFGNVGTILIKSAYDWTMFYEACNAAGSWRIGKATSTAGDGTTWTKGGANPIAGSTTQDRGRPNVFLVGEHYWAWTHGSEAKGGPTQAYRYSLSDDFEIWTQSPAEPILPRISGDEGVYLGSQGVGQIADLCICPNDDTVLFYYTARTNQSWGAHIKLAIADMSISSLVLTNEGAKPDLSGNDLRGFASPVTLQVIQRAGSGLSIPPLAHQHVNQTPEDLTGVRITGAEVREPGTYNDPAAGYNIQLLYNRSGKRIAALFSTDTTNPFSSKAVRFDGGTIYANAVRTEESLHVFLRNYVTAATWLSSTSAADNAWGSICWASELGLFCAVAANGANRAMTSPDGITWTARSCGTDIVCRGICWSPELGLFCAVSSAGSQVMTSPDGITWTARSGASSNGWRSVCWSSELGIFCAVASSGTGNRVMTSPDGITWTSRTSAADNDWLSVCWASELGLFCATANSGTGNRVMTSPDGITWTIRVSAANYNWLSVCWSLKLGLFCAVADNGGTSNVMTSPDGVTWTSRTTNNNQWQSVCWSPKLGLFCAVSASGTATRVMTSPDGITWTSRTSAVDNDWLSVCWASELGLFCATSSTGTNNRVMTSISANSYAYRSA